MINRFCPVSIKPVTPFRYLITIALLFIVVSFYPSETQDLSVSDRDLEDLSLHLSGEPGYFNTDNLISNESSYLQILPRLAEISKPGQVYLGVGPDQNFTYVSHVRPSLAIIIDVRRDNLLLHLLLKELIERSNTRWEYLSYLFGKPLPAGFEIPPGADAVVLAERIRELPSNQAFFERNFERVWTAIQARFPRLVHDNDYSTFYRMANTFFEENLALKYRSHGRIPRVYYPSFEELMTETSRSAQRGHYLNLESDFQFVKRLQSENRLIPVIGDLAGPEVVKKVGRHLEERGYTVSAFYVSNVEFYLFRGGRFSDYIANLKSLPIDENSVLIRSYFNYWRGHPETVSGYYVTSLLQYLGRFLKLHEQTPYRSYWEVVTRDYVPAGVPAEVP